MGRHAADIGRAKLSGADENAFAAAAPGVKMAKKCGMLYSSEELEVEIR
jgi:hypothetical protein